MTSREGIGMVGSPRSRTWAGSITAAASLVVVVSACGGSSSSGSVTVPSVTGLGMTTAASRLCRAGVLVAVNEVHPSHRSASPAIPVGRHVVLVTGTTPPAGSVVHRRSVVTLDVATPSGVATLVRLPPACTPAASPSSP